MIRVLNRYMLWDFLKHFLLTLAVIAVFGIINRRLNRHLPQESRRRIRFRPQIIR